MIALTIQNTVTQQWVNLKFYSMLKGSETPFILIIIWGGLMWVLQVTLFLNHIPLFDRKAIVYPNIGVLPRFVAFALLSVGNTHYAYRNIHLYILWYTGYSNFFIFEATQL